MAIVYDTSRSPLEETFFPRHIFATNFHINRTKWLSPNGLWSHKVFHLFVSRLFVQMTTQKANRVSLSPQNQCSR